MEVVGLRRGPPSAQYGFGTELFKYFVFGDPDWDYTRYDFSTWEEDVAPTGAILNATDTDLGRFRDGGGRIIYWTGWSDLALTPLGTISTTTCGSRRDDAAARDLRPASTCCPACSTAPAAPAPTASTGSRPSAPGSRTTGPPSACWRTSWTGDGEVAMTRPVCPYPQVAVYDGSGATRTTKAALACAIPSL